MVLSRWLFRFALAALVLLPAVFHSAGSLAQSAASRAPEASIQAGSEASVQAAQAVGASGRAAVALSSVPIGMAGSVATAVGQTSTAMAEAGVQAAETAPGTPLPLTPRVITVMPPRAALHEAPAQTSATPSR
jgi:hypothetical protein